jgi:hypothetical protein
MTTEKDERDTSEDVSLKMLNAKRLLELKKRANLASAKNVANEKSPGPSERDILLGALVERGDEVLFHAESSYPNEMRILIPRLADLVKTRKVTTISGGELLQFLRAVGLRVSVPTSISIEEHGKTVSLSDKLREHKD